MLLEGRRALAAPDDRPVSRLHTETAIRQLTQIRWVVGTNLVLGLLTVAIGASGRYWG